MKRENGKSLDVEQAGIRKLADRLMAEGLGVAWPDGGNRGRLFDLIVFLETARNALATLPLQVQVSASEPFAVWRKYEHHPDILHALVWNALSNRPRFFLLAYSEMEALVPSKHKLTASWNTIANPGWRDPTASSETRRALELHHEDRWAWLRTHLESKT